MTDIHGCFLTFQKLYTDLKVKFPNEKFVICGDLIDRGPSSKDVIEFIIKNNIDCVRGNHEQMMLDETSIIKNSLNQDSLCVASYGIWLPNGGTECLKSYEINGELDVDIFLEHREWISNLPLYLEYKDIVNDRGQYLLITHASANNKDIDFICNNHEILWNRQPSRKIKSRFNVFGHTPQCSWKPKFNEPKITKYYACIDTACYYKTNGKLTALRFPQMEVYQQENIDYEKE